MKKPYVYLDYNASTPIAPQVAAAMRPYLDKHYGNPSSAHWAGRATSKAVEHAREQMADLLGCQSDEIVFTSGGSEANNYALKGVYSAHRNRRRPHIVTTQIEHPAILEPCRFLEQLGARITYLPVDNTGLVDPDDVRSALLPETVLISVMHANNEVGTIQPIEAISEIAREHGVLFHTDAAQSVGKIPVNVDALGVDLLSVAGHKLYAPKGVGALYVRQGVALTPLVHGANHENGRRAGTESVLLDVGLGAACALAKAHLPNVQTRLLRDYFCDRLRASFGSTLILNGHPEHRLPNTLNVSFLGRDASRLLARIDNVAAATGSACHADRVDMSPVLAAMQVPEDIGMGAVRFSLGRYTTQAELDYVVERFTAMLPKA